jgi:hypothetical protein
LSSFLFSSEWHKKKDFIPFGFSKTHKKRAYLPAPLGSVLDASRGAEKKKKKNDGPHYRPFFGFFEIFRSDLRKYVYGVFRLLMQRNGQKRDKKKSMGKDERKKVFFPQLFRPKIFDTYFPRKAFYGVFELPLLRNAQQRWVKTKGGGKKISTFSAKKFLMVFLNSPC